LYKRLLNILRCVSLAAAYDAPILQLESRIRIRHVSCLYFTNTY